MFQRLPPELRLEIYHLILSDPVLLYPHDQYKLSRRESQDLVRHTQCPLLRTNKHIRSEYAPLIHRSFVHRFAVSDRGIWWPTQTPQISSVYGTNEKWVAAQDLRPEMSRWKIEVTLGDEPYPGAARDEHGYLVTEYDEDVRDRRRKRAMASIAKVRMWLRCLVLRLLGAGVVFEKVNVVVWGADLGVLRQGGGGGDEDNTDLLAPLNELSVRSGGRVDIEIAMEGKESMDGRCKGYQVAVANRRYAEEVREAMMREKGETKDRRMKHESSLLAKNISDTLSRMLAEDDDPKGEGARERLQAALRSVEAETKFDQPWTHWDKLFKATEEYLCYRREEIDARHKEAKRELWTPGMEEKAHRMLEKISQQIIDLWMMTNEVGGMRIWLPVSRTTAV
ncbi:MAG: hypothetical protein Q9208_004187 [Pyrenodesmia sp. 3 TL-2023]